MNVMKINFKSILPGVIATGIIASTLSTVSTAAVIFTATVDGGTTTTIASHVNSAAPIAGFSFIDGFSISFTGGFTNSPGDEETGAMSTFTSFGIQNTSSETKTIELLFAADGFMYPGIGTMVDLSSTLNGNMQSDQGADGGSTVTYQTYINEENKNEAAGTVTSGLMGPLDIDGFAKSTSWGPLENQVRGVTQSSIYAFVQQISFTLEGGEALNFNATAHVKVPEPSIAALFGLGLVGLILGRRRTLK
jgi:hypothetical protein